MIWVILAACTAALDLGIKCWIEKQGEEDFPREIKGFGGKLILNRFYNAGFPFGILKEHKNAVKYLPLCVMAVVSACLLSLLPSRKNAWKKFSLALILGGAVSNQYDRIKRGHVVDYLIINWKPVKRVVVNLGDLFIFSGSILLLIQEVFPFRKN